MPNLKPWYQVVTPREDLREGRPLEAWEIARLAGGRGAVTPGTEERRWAEGVLARKKGLGY